MTRRSSTASGAVRRFLGGHDGVRALREHLRDADARVPALRRRFDMSFVPAENFSTRSKPLYDAETQRIDVIMYKITEGTHADGLIRAVNRGVPVRLITEPERYRNQENVWHAYQVDRLYMAGVQIRHRAHEGFTHQKTTLLYSQGLDDLRLVELDVGVQQVAVRAQLLHRQGVVLRLVQDATSSASGATRPATPKPRRSCRCRPSRRFTSRRRTRKTDVSTSTATTISWKPGPWAHRADIYFGTSPTPPLLAVERLRVAQGPRRPTRCRRSRRDDVLLAVVNKTIAKQDAAGSVYSFTTAGGDPAAASPTAAAAATTAAGGHDIVLYAGATTVAGAWVSRPMPPLPAARRSVTRTPAPPSSRPPLASPVELLRDDVHGRRRPRVSPLDPRQGGFELVLQRLGVRAVLRLVERRRGHRSIASGRRRRRTSTSRRAAGAGSRAGAGRTTAGAPA